MISSNSPLQDRRGASRALGLDVSASLAVNTTTGTSLPPLKSPRGHLLDRIRSTPRTSKFVPQGAQAPTAVSNNEHPISKDSWQNRAEASTPMHRRGSSTSTPARANSNIYTPQRHAYSNSITSATPANHDLAKNDQLAILEQQLRSQNSLLAQQQMLLQKLQYQQQQSAACPTPPYTPEARGNPAANSIIYDPTTGQYYMYAPQYTTQPQFQYTVTPAQQKAQLANTPESYSRSARTADDRSPSPAKEGTSSRQPKGPPAIEILVQDKDNSTNFANRRKSTTRSRPLVEAGLSRKLSTSPTQLTRPASRSSLRSNNSLGPIEEAFPAITL